MSSEGIRITIKSDAKAFKKLYRKIQRDIFILQAKIFYWKIWYSIKHFFKGLYK